MNVLSMGRKGGFQRCIIFFCFVANSLALKMHQISIHGGRSNALGMVAADLSKSEVSTMSKYPTKRGETVDSRKIVKESGLTAVRLNHVLFLSEELATNTLERLKQTMMSFDELASQISACTETREKGGSVGWVSISEFNDDGSSELNEHLNLILPPDARRAVLEQTTKPGDIVQVQSDRGFHLVQLVDVMVDVRKVVNRKARGLKQRTNQSKKGGILGGALVDGANHDLTYKIETMGCQMNLADSERMEGQLQNLGLTPAGDDRKPDLVVLNTCSIRDHAEQKVYSYLGPHTKRKREGEDVAIVVAGCVAQQEGETLLRRAPELDLVLGPQYANRLGDLLEDVANGNQVVATEAAHIMEDSTKPRRGSKVAAWVNIIYGCNERCTYCIVPTTRGVEQSRPVESIIQEVQDLVSQGYKEVTLLGQNIDAYGRDMVPKKRFSDLLRTVGALEGLERLRFVTSHPRYMSLGVVDAVADTPAACESFHVPFQSGSNRILAAMGRGHTREKYMQIINRIRARLPDASITADVIVGFPGETEQDFQDTLSLMEKVRFDSVNTAAYSPRPNTPAAVWKNQLSEETKKDRLQRINAMNLKHADERRKRMVGRIIDVLVEERNAKLPGQVMGRSRHGYIVYFNGNIDLLRGLVVDVLIEEAQTYHLRGREVEQKS